MSRAILVGIGGTGAQALALLAAPATLPLGGARMAPERPALLAGLPHSPTRGCAAEALMSDQSGIEPATELQQTKQDVMRGIAFYRATGNPIFLWEAVQAMTSPSVAGLPIIIPDEIRSYLYVSAEQLVRAGTSPPGEFNASALKALGLSRTSGESVPKSYARDQGVGIFLGIYEEVKRRTGSAEAAIDFIAGAMNKDRKTISTRLTYARKVARKVAEEMASSPQQIDPTALGSRFTGLPEVVLQQLVRGLPDVFWQGRTGGLRTTKV